jgi:hypothetical protein
MLSILVLTTFSPSPSLSGSSRIYNKIKAATIHSYHCPDNATWKQFKDAGVTHIVLVPKATIYGYPKSVNLNDVGDSPYWSESVKGIKEAVRTANIYGIQVIVKLHLYMRETETAKGRLETIPYSPKLGEEYTQIVLRYAKLCQDLKIPIFVMCNEATEFYKETEYWTSLIKEVRTVYFGKITIGACASDIKDVKFWGKLDYIGVSAYYPVALRKNPTETEMKVGWNWHKNALCDISAKYNKPVLFTEFGCNAGESLAIKPWEWQKNINGEKKNYVLQASYYKTMFETFWDANWFAGVCIWQTYSLSEFGKQGESLGTPQGHEAWEVLKSF